MGFYSRIWIEVIELAEQGYDAEQIANKVNDKVGHEVITERQVDDCIDEYVQDTKECA
jgi:hypothetical protein